MTKAQAQRKHAMKRARERYDVWLTDRDYDALVFQIQQSQAVLVFNESVRVGHFIVTHEGVHMLACYDRNRKTIATFLPYEALKGYGT